MLVVPFGIVILVRPEQFSNAFEPIVDNVLGKFTLERFFAPENAFALILVTPSGAVYDVFDNAAGYFINVVHDLLNKTPPMLVYFELVSDTSILVSFEQPSNAYEPIDVTPLPM